MIKQIAFIELLMSCQESGNDGYLKDPKARNQIILAFSLIAL